MSPFHAKQLEKLKARLGAIPQSIREAVKPSLKASGEALVTEMKRLAPVESGELRDSIKLTLPGQTTPPNAIGGSHAVPENKIAITAGDANVIYAGMVEFGTSHAHAQPFFMPGYRSLRGKVIGDLRTAVTAAVKAGNDRS